MRPHWRGTRQGWAGGTGTSVSVKGVWEGSPAGMEGQNLTSLRLGFRTQETRNLSTSPLDLCCDTEKCLLCPERERSILGEVRDPLLSSKARIHTFQNAQEEISMSTDPDTAKSRELRLGLRGNCRGETPQGRAQGPLLSHSSVPLRKILLQDICG